MEKKNENENVINVNIKFSGRSIPVSLFSDSTVRDLKSLLQTLTIVQLYIANNKLTHVPTEIGHLTQLQVLKANNNRYLCTMVGLVLHLSNNGLKSLPSVLFKMCIQLSTLDLHASEITMDLLRQFERWEYFDKRHRLKHQKQLDFRVGGSAEFDEGADKSF
ncbi:LRR repeats and ubiquitin-like domain-containing protein At2g30105 [Actinidia eriantha]|uniref:LRR repeats and ubiquitin-like domain-containing protein At2g30105 n=1 Tax=Actinidia eriantha TaxID=165200 RepID=UPI00258C58A4|nr:LRR repeats and ubiquitin-like domain-containing protein At2g30105 [Actinidia eriantha]